MIRTRALPRPVRTGVALLGVAGTFAFAGCAATAADAETDPTTSAPVSTAESTPSTDSEAVSSSTFTDGTYTATGSYQTPESVEEITVTVTVADDVVTVVEVTGTPTKAESREYQAKFIGGISDVVVGKNLDELSVSRVAGSSLTSTGFNQAIEEITSEAAA